MQNTFGFYDMALKHVSIKDLISDYWSYH